MALKEVDVKSLDINPFTAIGDDWMLVTAGDAASHNTMTASWGGLGVLWGAPRGHLLHPPEPLHQGVRGRLRPLHAELP